jgi:hypothetical protein
MEHIMTDIVAMTHPMHRGVSRDYDIPQGQDGCYVITEEYRDGYVVLARFKRLADAERYLRNMSKNGK